MSRRNCQHCTGRSVAATSRELILLNFALKEHALCLWGDGWEICLSPHTATGDGQIIKDKGGARRGVMYTLN